MGSMVHHCDLSDCAARASAEFAAAAGSTYWIREVKLYGGHVIESRAGTTTQSKGLPGEKHQLNGPGAPPASRGRQARA
mgnify:CR=1